MPTVIETKATVSCDAQNCTKSISWVEQDVQNDPFKLPDDFFRFLILQDAVGRRMSFCSASCLRRTLKSYVPPLSPREEAAIQKNNSMVDEKNRLKEMPGIEGLAALQYQPRTVEQETREQTGQ